jgi:hypothetical protein
MLRPRATRKATDKEAGGATRWMDVRTGYNGRGDGNEAVMGAAEREGKHRPRRLERVGMISDETKGAYVMLTLAAVGLRQSHGVHEHVVQADGAVDDGVEVGFKGEGVADRK